MPTILTQFNLIAELKRLEDLLRRWLRVSFLCLSPYSRLGLLSFLLSRDTSHQIQADHSIREAKSCNDVKMQGFSAAWSIGYKFPNGLMLRRSGREESVIRWTDNVMAAARPSFFSSVERYLKYKPTKW